jgi:hypothetical protein
MFMLRRQTAQIAAGSTRRKTPRNSESNSVRRFWVRLAAAVALAAFLFGFGAKAQSARFDLTGPKVEVRVTRAGVTLPIASVPNLQPGDRLWLHPALPASQSVHYLMVLAFLRGTTNPPPDNWFIRIETWQKKVREEGVEVTVPDEAQQAVLFLAPVTGGDFATLRSAVQGRPGVFVRASQDLNAAGFEQGRIEKYIDSMKQIPPEQAADPKQLLDNSNHLATTLALKPNADCMKLPPDQQYTCLTQTGSQMLLDDGHGQTVVDALTGNNGAGLISQASYTQLAGGGLYSAYVGSIVDLVHILGSLHVAQYQYIPAIAFPQQQSLNLRLNTPPSFHNPKSVIVIGLPAIQQTVPPPLRATDPRHVSCLQKPDVVLPVDGAPLVYSTALAHDLVLHLNYPSGDKPGPNEPQDIPLSADASRGGLVLTTIPKRHPLVEPPEKASLPGVPADQAGATPPANPQPPAAASSDPVASAALTGAELTGTIKGSWGFDPFNGPTLPLQETPGKDWKLAVDSPIIAGKNQQIVISSTGTACIQSIALEPASGTLEKETWKRADQPNQVDVTLDVPAHDSGAMHLAIQQFGESNPATVSLVSYALPAKIDGVSFHSGDSYAILTGTSLGEVRQVELGHLVFKPQGDPTDSPIDPARKSDLRVALLKDAKASELPPGDSLTAQVALDDGRSLSVPVTVEGPRPILTLISKADLAPGTAASSPFRILVPTQDDMPVGDSLQFSLKSAHPFPRAGKIEIASPDGSLHTTLNPADPGGTLILGTPDTLLATLEPLKAFGPSAFGTIRLRGVAPDGTAGDWLPLVTLVRLPTFTHLTCPVAAPATSLHRPKAPAAGPVDSAAAATPPAHDADQAPEPAADATPDTSAATAAASCTLAGTGLYFVDSIATDEAFTNPTRVPEGFVGTSIPVPPPTGAAYYLRLRDDPAAIDTLTLPAGPL